MGSRVPHMLQRRTGPIILGISSGKKHDFIMPTYVLIHRT